MSTVAEILRSVSRRFEPANWLQPLDPRPVKAALALAVTEDISSDLLRVEYPEVPVREYLAALGEARESLREKARLNPMAEAVGRHIRNLEERALATAKREDEGFSRTTAILDGLPSPRLTESAWELLRETSPRCESPEHPWTAGEAAQALRSSLDAYSLAEWSVVVSDKMAARMSVNGPLKRVRVRADASFSLDELKRLLVHEVGGHVLRWVNSDAQELDVATLPLGRSIVTEEGLALWHEESFGLADQGVRRLYAARVVAVALAQSLGAVELMRTLGPLVGTSAATEIVLRVKRGLTNLQAPGGSTKDWSYLGGIEQMRALGARDPEGLMSLQGVKWGSQHLDLVKSLQADGRLRPPSVLPDDRLFPANLQT